MLIYLEDYYELYDLYCAVRNYHVKYKRYGNLLRKIEHEMEYYGYETK